MGKAEMRNGRAIKERSEGRNEAVAEVVIDVFLDILRLEDLDEFLVGRVLFILLAGCDDIDIRRGIVFGREGGLATAACMFYLDGLEVLSS